MGIESLSNRADYIGNNTTAIYDFPFKIFSKTHLTVIQKDLTGVETELQIDTNYTVDAGSINNNAGGSITLKAGNLPTNYTLTIQRTVPLNQQTDLRNQGQFYPETHENAFDYGCMINQQQQDQIDRSIKLPASIDPSTFNATLPSTISGKASAYLATNNTGTGLTAVDAVLDTAPVPTGDGLLGKSGQAVSLREIVGESPEITVSNGDGISGNPTVSLSTVPFEKLNCTINDATMATASETTISTSASTKSYVDSKTNPIQTALNESTRKVVALPNNDGRNTIGGYYIYGAFILNTGDLRLFGNNTTYYPMGIGTYSSNLNILLSPAFPQDFSGKIIQWKITYHSNFVLTDTGEVWVWGYNQYGELGVGNTAIVYTPQKLTALSGVTVVDIQVPTIDSNYVNYWHVLFLTSTGAVYSCGYNGSGQLGIANTTSQSTPQLLAKSNFTSIYAYNFYSAGIDSNGDLYTWGNNNYGQLGLGDTTNRNVPTIVNAFGGESVTKFSGFFNYYSNTYRYNSFAMLSTGAIYGWGRNDNYDLGLGNTSQYNTPQLIPVGTDNLDIVTGSNNAYILKSDHSIVSCGYNNNGQTGTGGTTTQQQFTTMIGSLRPGHSVVKIQPLGVNIYLSVVVLYSDGYIACCGYNGNGQLANGFPVGSQPELTPILGINIANDKPVDIAPFGNNSTVAFFCALTEKGTVYSSRYILDGYNTYTMQEIRI
jgi:hypothetical protein